MAIFPKLKVKPPKMAHHDLTHYFRTSMAVGPLVPILVRECNPGDEHYMNFESLVNTQALLSPLYGSFRLKIMAFFAGTSLYIPKLWRNGSMQTDGGTLDANYPLFQISQPAASVDGYRKVHPSSLLAYLGFPAYFANPFTADASENSNYLFNAIPILMYYDILRHYFVNRQERNYKVISNVTRGNTSIATFPISQLDDYYLNLPVDGGKLIGLPFGDLTSNDNLDNPMYGLALGTYMPDMMNVILNKDFYQNNVSSVEVSTVGDSFQIDQLVTAKKLWNSRNKDAMSNGTFKDWIRLHYGVTPKIMDDMPTFLGASSSDIGFEDIRATTTQQVGEATQYLGDKSSSGLGYGNTRTFRLSVDRPGYLMVLAQIVPYVDYYQGLERFTLHRKLSDAFRPEFNGIGLQDVLVSDLNCSYPTANKPSASGLNDVPWQHGLGKQPAFIEQMTAVNRVRGTFCTTEKSWVLARNMQATGDLEEGNYNPVGDTNSSAYINPSDWNQPFALQDESAQNFLVQFKITHKVRSTVLKRLLPQF